MRVLLWTAVLAVFILGATFIAFLVIRDAGPADPLFRRGRSLFETQNYLDALPDLREAARQNRRSADAHDYLGATYLRLHLYGAAQREFAEASRLRPNAADSWIGSAVAYLETGKFAEAKTSAERATVLNASSAEAWFTLGRAHWFQRNYAEAEQAAEKARKLKPDDSQSAELLLRIYADQDRGPEFDRILHSLQRPSKPVVDLAVEFRIRHSRFAEAFEMRSRFDQLAKGPELLRQELSVARQPDPAGLGHLIRGFADVGLFSDVIRVSKLYPNISAGAIDLGKAYWAAGQMTEAVRELRRASAEKLHALSAEIALAVITGDRGHWARAFQAERPNRDYYVLAKLEPILTLDDPAIKALVWRYASIFVPSLYGRSATEAALAIDKAPRDLQLLLTAGTAYHKLRRLDEAERYFELARQYHPREREPLSRLASVAIDRGQPARVVQLMEGALRMNPNHAGDLYNLGWLSEQMGDTERAIKLYERAISASLLSFEALNNLALIHAERGDLDRARALLDRAIATDPENEIGYFNLADHFARRRDWKAAIGAYDRVLFINETNSAARIGKGRILLDLGKLEDATESLNQALEINPQSSDAYVLLATAYERMGNAREAIAAAEEALRVKDETPEAKALIERLRGQAP